MNVFNVPGEEAIEKRVKDHHEDDKEQAVLVVLHRADRHVVPLHADTFDLVQRKVLGAEAKRRR